MTTLADAIEGLEAALGDPRHDDDTGFAPTLKADEDESFPLVGWAKLGSVGFARELVPTDLGGAFTDAERLLVLGRTVARRDLTLAIATGQCLLGALPVWIAGDELQRRFVADAIANGEAGALALTERAHGSDLAATATSATPDGSGFRLDGEKWAINNASRGRYLTVLARTDEAGGPRGFSVFLVDTLAISAGTEALPKLRTLGIRGADISGRVFEDAPLDAAALVGKAGHGLDLVQRTMQVSRTLCAAFSLGAADTALRAAIGFADERVLYGQPAIALGAPRAVLRDAFVRLYAADLLAHATARALSITPEQTSVTSAIAKTFVTESAVAIVEGAANVLGARHYLRDGRQGIVQKIIRDVRLVPLFDGSTSVNRSALASQAARVASVRLEGEELGDAVARTRALVDVGSAIDPIPFDRLKVTSRGECDPVHSLAAFAGGLYSVPAGVRPLAARANAVAERLRTVYGDPGTSGLPGTHERAHRLADVFSELFLVALLLARSTLAAEDELVVLEAALRRSVAWLEGTSPLDTDLDDPVDSSARLDAAMTQCFTEGRAFGVLGARLAETPATWRAS